MTDTMLLYIGSGIVTLWGVAHVAPTRSVVNGFGPISSDNRRIITMEWIAEGLALSFIGLLVLFVTALDGPNAPVAASVYRACATMLVAMAGLTLVTGARTSVVPIKLCPLVKTTCAVLILAGSFV